MRDMVIAMAQSRGISVSELRREALDFFLSKIDTETTKFDSNVSNTKADHDPRS